MSFKRKCTILRNLIIENAPAYSGSGRPKCCLKPVTKITYPKPGTKISNPKPVTKI